jgi:hypothetical protein
MMKSVSLACPGCGASLSIRESVNRFHCTYCGGGFDVIREGGTISLENISASIHSTKESSGRTASELALVRLGKELRAEQARLDLLRRPEFVAPTEPFFTDIFAENGMGFGLTRTQFRNRAVAGGVILIVILAFIAFWLAALFIAFIGVVGGLTYMDYSNRKAAFVLEKGNKLQAYKEDLDKWNIAFSAQAGKISNLERQIEAHREVVSQPLNTAI